MKIKIKKILILLFFSIFLALGSLLKISFGLGSYRFFFSGINFIFPILGSLFSLPISAFLVSAFFIFKKIAFGGIITMGIPTLFATLNFSNSLNPKKKFLKKEILNFLLQIFLPILSIILFCIHPEGQKACLYSFYWLIPIAIYLIKKFKNYNSIFLTSLSSTFIAHATGSIIWLYLLNLSYVKWLSLIPIVAVERLVFACGINLGYLFFKTLKNKNLAFSIKTTFFNLKPNERNNY